MHLTYASIVSGKAVLFREKKWIFDFHNLKKRVVGYVIEGWRGGVLLIVKEFVFN